MLLMTLRREKYTKNWAALVVEGAQEMDKTKEVLLILQIMLLIWILHDSLFNRKHVLPQVQPQTTAPSIKTINKLILMAKYNLNIWDLLEEHIQQINLIHMKGTNMKIKNVHFKFKCLINLAIIIFYNF